MKADKLKFCSQKKRSLYIMYKDPSNKLQSFRKNPFFAKSTKSHISSVLTADLIEGTRNLTE